MKRGIILGFLASALLGGAISSILVVNMMQKRFVTSQDLFNPNLKYVSNQDGQAQVGAPNFVYASEQSIHSVVHIKTYSSQRQSVDPLYEFFFGYQPRQQQPTPRGVGSGVIVTKDGYIVTNNHVIDDAEKIEVTLNDKRSFTAKVVGADPNTDLALLKIDASDLPFIKMGNSDQLSVGEWVIAVGNPFNLTSTVTAGIVSAKGRNFPVRLRNDNPYKIESYIQTDAVVNPGNSGGALVNVNGELVGINTAIYTQNGVFNGYSFAIPSSIVKKVIYDLMEFGSIQRAYLGVSMGEITSDNYKQLKLKDVVKGVYVAEAIEGGAAKDAGIATGDVIQAINGEEITSTAQVAEQIGRYRPGDIVEISVNRDGKVKQFKVTLRKTASGAQREVASNGKFSTLGATFANVSPQVKSSLRLRGGVQITTLEDGSLKSQGIRKGLIILRVNRVAINSVEDLADVFSTIQQGEVATIEGVYPNGLQAMYSIGI